MNALPSIPWRVQSSPDDTRNLSPEWKTVQAPTSRMAAVAFMAAHPEIPRPCWVYVAPSSRLLCHPNGQPICCRSFQVVAAKPQASLCA